MYLKCKLQEDSYGWCIFKWKCQKTVERTYLEEENTKEKTADVFRCESGDGKVRIVILDFAKTQRRYSLCI